MKELLCRILGHNYKKMKEKWTPSIDAPIVTKWELWFVCKRCGETHHDVSHFE